MLHVPPPTNQPILQQIRSVLQVAKSCCRKSDSSYTSCNKIFILCCTFYRPKANLHCSKWRRTRVWCDSRVILSNQKSVFTQLATAWFVARQVWTKVVKRATPLFNLFCSNVAKQVASVCCSFYRSFKLAWCFGNSPHVSTSLILLNKQLAKRNARINQWV